MRKEDEIKVDALREYFKKTNIEKAPEGFTSKVMSHIYMQAKPVKQEKKYLVLLFYAGITVLLITASFFVPESTLKFPKLELPANIHFTFPQFAGSSSVPQIILYIIAGGVLLVVFDSALKGLFYRQKS